MKLHIPNSLRSQDRGYVPSSATTARAFAWLGIS